MHTYNSSATHNSCAETKKKRQVSELAQASFEAFEPFINIFDPGIKLEDGGIIHTITKEDWKLFRRYKAGEKPHYPDGRRFHPYLDVIRNIYSPGHVHRHIENNQVTYFTSGRDGQGLLYADIDAHSVWQTDQVRARQLLEKLFPFGYYRNSPRGENGYWKIRYSSIAEFNDVANRLENTLQRLFLHCGILCDIEIKGKITEGDVSGKLAKLPFSSRYGPDLLHRKEWGWWELELLKTTEEWCWARLEQFKNRPIVKVRRVDRIAEQIERVIDEEKVANFSKVKEAIRREHERKAISTVAPVPVSVIAATSASRAIGDSPVTNDLTPKLVAKSSTVHSAKRGSPSVRTGSCDGDAFTRNQKDLLPFVRRFYKQHRKFPGVEDALIHLRDNGLFSGCWEVNESRRTRRVDDILRYTHQTFDPGLLGSEETVSLSLTVNKYSWWVRQHLGSGLTAELIDLRRFDPISMTAPKRRVSVPAKFIETFLVVADACLAQDPLDNKAVPTNRFKKIWTMVKGGASWNQSYFQIVRDRLDRMGVIRIVDRQHESGKAWRWETGTSFPAHSWKEEQTRLKQRCERLKVSSGDLPSPSSMEKEQQVHNTLYETGSRISENQDRRQAIRPPP